MNKFKLTRSNLQFGIDLLQRQHFDNSYVNLSDICKYLLKCNCYTKSQPQPYPYHPKTPHPKIPSHQILYQNILTQKINPNPNPNPAPPIPKHPTLKHPHTKHQPHFLPINPKHRQTEFQSPPENTLTQEINPNPNPAPPMPKHPSLKHPHTKYNPNPNLFPPPPS